MTASIIKSTDKYTATVTNNGEENNVYIISAAYRNGKLYDVKYVQKTVAEGASEIIDCEIPSVPKMLGGVVTSKAFVWSKIFGAEEIASFK